MKNIKRITAVALVIMLSTAATASVFANERGFGRGLGHRQGHRQAVCRFVEQDSDTVERGQGFGRGRGHRAGQGHGFGLEGQGVRQRLNSCE